MSKGTIKRYVNYSSISEVLASKSAFDYFNADRKTGLSELAQKIYSSDKKLRGEGLKSIAKFCFDYNVNAEALGENKFFPVYWYAPVENDDAEEAIPKALRTRLAEGRKPSDYADFDFSDEFIGKLDGSFLKRKMPDGTYLIKSRFGNGEDQYLVPFVEIGLDRGILGENELYEFVMLLRKRSLEINVDEVVDLINAEFKRCSGKAWNQLVPSMFWPARQLKNVYDGTSDESLKRALTFGAREDLSEDVLSALFECVRTNGMSFGGCDLCDNPIVDFNEKSEIRLDNAIEPEFDYDPFSEYECERARREAGRRSYEFEYLPYMLVRLLFGMFADIAEVQRDAFNIIRYRWGEEVLAKYQKNLPIILASFAFNEVERAGSREFLKVLCNLFVGWRPAMPVPGKYKVKPCSLLKGDDARAFFKELSIRMHGSSDKLSPDAVAVLTCLDDGLKAYSGKGAFKVEIVPNRDAHGNLLPGQKEKRVSYCGVFNKTFETLVNYSANPALVLAMNSVVKFITNIDIEETAWWGLKHYQYEEDYVESNNKDVSFYGSTVNFDENAYRIGKCDEEGDCGYVGFEDGCYRTVVIVEGLKLDDDSAFEQRVVITASCPEEVTETLAKFVDESNIYEPKFTVKETVRFNTLAEACA